ncbi:DoxX family protein [Streptomyces europaeiscabiei]|uniref:DoxX family protein n=1 Tax=Streptomyces europaeiscabiei TaxID=146819 RepID=A0AAJ2PN03_9ACTN|nr:MULTISPECIES: DoxX family protein [Streptomyces]KFG00950.1 membrane protein [Streptomyces scabiei]MDX3130179.1 DoxX family protein [Streptomyces europaeiscabiei]
MNVTLWIITGLLAAAFLAAGLMKSTRSREKLAASGMTWVEDFSPGMVKAIGVLEALAAVGLILPAALDTAPVFVPLAATGLVVTMIGAVVVHVRRKENQAILPSAVFLILAALVAWGRFGPYSF